MDNHQATGMNSRRNRNSILQSAGDALGFRLNKRKRMSTISNHGQSPSYTDSHSKQTPSIFDDVVLEISANGNNGFYPQPTLVEYAEDDSAEREARERLRDAAAQAVGLPQASTNPNFYSTSTTMTNGAPNYSEPPTEHRPTPARTHSGKSRGSMMKTAGTTTGSGLPRYPCTLSSMQSHVQNAATLQKFNSNPSPFLILSRSRQWKTRYIAITSIEQKYPRRTESHLHLFKSGALDDRELERIRIHTHSIVYVADEEVGGGRQFVIKIGGMTVDASSKDTGPTTWLLQMPDSIQMQRWIQIVKNAVLLQKYVKFLYWALCPCSRLKFRAEQDGPVAEVYHNTYGNARQERKSDTDMPGSAKRRQSFGPASGLPTANTIDSGIDNPNAGTQINGNPTSLGAVSALNRLWNNNRPTSRQLSVSGSSIATAFATPSLNSQASVHIPPPPTAQPPTVPSDTEPPPHEVVPSKSRESMLYNLFRPTSPPIPTHQQQQPSITHMSPPISPTVSLPFTEDTVTSQSSTIATSATRFSPNGSGRHAHHSSSFSVDWDAIDGGSLGVINAKRNNPILQTALAPPPRRRPLTGGGLSQRQPSPPKDVLEEEQNMSPSPITIVRPLPIPLEDAQQSFESEDGGDVTMETALRGQGGQRSYFDDEDDEELEDHEHELGMVQEVTTEYRAPLDMSPMSAHSHGHDDVESQRSANLPSPLQRPNLPLSSASSFGAAGSTKTAMHEHGSLGSRDDLITEEDQREGGEIDGSGDPVNQFHLPTGRRRSRLSSVPRQLAPPTGPPPPVPMPMFHSPPFPALSSPPPNDYSGSERPGSSSSIPSTVPSMQAGGLSSLLSKRISTMSSEAPSIKSTESSGGGSMNNSKLVGSSSYATGSSRLSVIPGPLGPRSSAFPPPRPAPNVAPPPAPLDDLSSIGGHQRLSLSSFGKGGPASPSSRSAGGGSGSASSRSEFVNRLTRYSVGPAGPPPTAALPPTPLVTADPDASISSAGGYLPRNSMSSFSSNGQSNIGSILFTIPASPATGKPSPNSGLPLPAMAPLPIRPLPPTPHLISADDAERRPVSPSALSTTSNRSSRSASALPFVRMSSLKQRLRMMSNPTPIRGEDGDVLASIPPAQPPPTFPLPETPYQARQTKSQSQQYINYSEISKVNEQGYNHVHAHAHSYSTSTPPPPITTPLGEAITSRLDHFPFGPGASTAQIASIPSGLASASSPGATSPGSTMSFASRALRTAMTSTSPPDITPLSPPPRRNSRASRDLTPAERERWKVVVAGLEEESGKAVTPYESVPAKHSAINLPSFTD